MESDRLPVSSKYSARSDQYFQVVRLLIAELRYPHGDNILLQQQTWTLDTDKPVARHETRFTFSRKATKWDLYDPLRENTFSLRQESDAAERPPPVDYVTDPCYIRVGASIFSKQEDDWMQCVEDEQDCFRHTPYWEQISFRHPYRLRSRRKDLRHRSRPAFTKYQRTKQRQDPRLSSDTDDSTAEQLSEDDSGSESSEQSSREYIGEGVSTPESLASSSAGTSSAAESSGGSDHSGSILEEGSQSDGESISDDGIDSSPSATSFNSNFHGQFIVLVYDPFEDDGSDAKRYFRDRNRLRKVIRC